MTEQAGDAAVSDDGAGRGGPGEDARRPDGIPPDQGSGTITLAVTLALVAGWVDAHVYLHVHDVFVANMSGNMIKLGMSVGLLDWPEAWPSTAALLAFVAGVAVGTRLNRRELRHAGAARTPALLAIEAALLAVLAAGLLATPAQHERGRWPAILALICLGALSMGLQAAALGRVGTIAVTTTYGTGALVRVGQRLVPPASGLPRAVADRARVIVILVSLLCGYVGGAAASALAGGAAWLMVLPVVVLVAAASWSARPAALAQDAGS